MAIMKQKSRICRNGYCLFSFGVTFENSTTNYEIIFSQYVHVFLKQSLEAGSFLGLFLADTFIAQHPRVHSLLLHIDHR